ncbi:Sucrase/ferredoxin-like-domain-containing protein [Mycena galericulata]|nr:Sucrase/ferredoxin-like-domain-containing protein [Mycena galericulata]
MLRLLRTRLGAVFSTKPSSPQPQVLHGTVASHRSYILINAPSPPTTFPSRFSTPVQRALQLQVTRWGGVVNFAWTGSQPDADGSTSVTAFSALGGRIHFPTLTLSNVDENQPVTGSEIYMYVCTHGARDCRCGDTGGKVFQALRDELDRRALADPSGPAKNVVLGEVGHVGGHQFAANLLVFPHGEWRAGAVDTILSSEIRTLYLEDPPMCREFWRGRMGLPKDEQLSLHSAHS